MKSQAMIITLIFHTSYLKLILLLYFPLGFLVLYLLHSFMNFDVVHMIFTFMSILLDIIMHFQLFRVLNKALLNSVNSKSRQYFKINNGCIFNTHNSLFFLLFFIQICVPNPLRIIWMSLGCWKMGFCFKPRIQSEDAIWHPPYLIYL